MKPGRDQRKIIRLETENRELRAALTAAKSAMDDRNDDHAFSIITEALEKLSG